MSLQTVDPSVVAKLEQALVQQSTPLSDKYRILFSLRNISGHEAHRAMLKGVVGHASYFRCQTVFHTQGFHM